MTMFIEQSTFQYRRKNKMKNKKLKSKIKNLKAKFGKRKTI